MDCDALVDPFKLITKRTNIYCRFQRMVRAAISPCEECDECGTLFCMVCSLRADPIEMVGERKICLRCVDSREEDAGAGAASDSDAPSGSD